MEVYVPYIILGIVLGLPLLLGLLLRVNSSFLFFSILAGDLLARYFTDDTELVTRMFIRNHTVEGYTELVLLVLPVVLTGLFLRHTVSKSKLFFYVIPYLITGVVLAAFALPLLPITLQQRIGTVELGRQLLSGTDTIVGAVVFIQLITLWITNRSHEKPEKKHH